MNEHDRILASTSTLKMTMDFSGCRLLTGYFHNIAFHLNVENETIGACCDDDTLVDEIRLQSLDVFLLRIAFLFVLIDEINEVFTKAEMPFLMGLFR